MLALGIDAQKLRLGWAIVSIVGEDAIPVSCGCDVVDGNPGDWIRWWCRSRFCHDIGLVYVEAPHVGASRRGAVEHAMFIGRVLQQAERQWPDAPVELIQPGEWKKLVGLPGNAQKAQIMAWAHAAGFDPKTQDAADASGIAAAGVVRNAEIVRAARA